MAITPDEAQLILAGEIWEAARKYMATEFDAEAVREWAQGTGFDAKTLQNVSEVVELVPWDIMPAEGKAYWGAALTNSGYLISITTAAYKLHCDLIREAHRRISKSGIN